MSGEIIPTARVAASIRLLRGEKIPKVLNLAVKRNAERFPSDFMFQLTVEEAEELRSRSQFVTLNRVGHHVRETAPRSSVRPKKR